MKKIVFAFLSAALAAPFSAAAEGKLYLYNWTDYTAPDLIEKFEAETGVDVVLDTFDTSETLLAKLKSGADNYDIIMIGNAYAPIFIQEGLLREVNAAELPGFGNISEQWQSPPWDPGNRYTVPWQLGSTSFMVDTDAYGGDIDTYEVLFNPPETLRGKIGMFNSPEEIVAMALIHLGHPLCSENKAQMKEVRDMLVAQKPHVKVYNSDGIKDRLVSGETASHMIWNGYATRSRAEKSSLKYAFPKEGVLTWVDNIAVPKGAQNPENAKKFIEFFLRPQSAAMQTNFAGYDSGNSGAAPYLAEDKKTAPELSPPAGAKFVFAQTCSPAAIALQDKIWTEIKK